MPLPTKSYHRLTELSARWCAPIEDLECYVQDGLLEVSVMAIALPVEVGRLEPDPEQGWVRVDGREEVLHGLQPVVAADLWPVFRHGSGRLTRLKPRSADGYVELAEGVEPLTVALPDLLVARAERERFEAAHDLAVPDARDAPSSDSAPTFLHRNNYTEVVMAGEVYRLGPLQAAVVRQLHEASHTPDPWRTGKELLAGSRAGTQRIVDLFKSKPNWRSLIVSDGRGRYRLNLADRPAARSSHRAYRRFPSLFMRAVPPRSHGDPTLSAA